MGPGAPRGCQSLGPVLPGVRRPPRVYTDMGLVERITPGIVEGARLPKVLFYLWRSEGIGLSEKERSKMGVTIHALHGSPGDLTRFIGPYPNLPFTLDPDLAMGFEEDDCRQAGNWRRDKNGQPLAEAPPRRGQEPAIPAGAPDKSDSMNFRYPEGFGRMGSERAQLRVRTRLVRIVAAAIRHYGDWRELPSTGKESWFALLPEGDIQRVTDGINAEPSCDNDTAAGGSTDTHVAA